MSESVNAAKRDFVAAMQQGDRAAVNRSALRLIELAPPLGKTWKSVATVLEHNGEHEASLRALNIWLEQAGSLPEIAFEIAGHQARSGHHALARETIAQIPGARLDPGRSAYLHGTVAINHGDRDVARENLRKATELEPHSGQAWIALAMVGRIDPSDAERIIAAERHFTGRSDIEAVAYRYALGRVFHQREEHRAAFDAFSEGARIMRGTIDFDPAALRDRIRDSMQGWTRETVERLSFAGGRTSDRGPIFVTGLPRSGTTLSEQILASHSAVGDGAELGLFRMIQQDVGGHTLAHLESHLARGGTVADLRGTYDSLLAQRMPGDRLVIDKSVLASGYMGFLTVLFPDRPVIWLRRDPVDNAWSAFSTFFLKSIEWSWSLDWIGQYFNLEDDLHRFWADLLPERILTVPYADLVTDPETWIRRIDAHAGLEFEPQQLAPHLSKRVVSTASASQVRDPINSSGLNSAAPYEPFMDEFLRSYRGQAGAVVDR